jgi:hypothetical protein
MSSRIAMGRVTWISGQQAAQRNPSEPVSFTPLVGSDATGSCNMETGMFRLLDNRHARWYTRRSSGPYGHGSTIEASGVPALCELEEGL